MDELFEQLRHVSLFSKLKTRTLKRIAELFERVDYEEIGFLSRQGEIGDRFFLLGQGKATVWHVDASGSEQAVRELQPGDYYGITSLFLGEERDATVRVAPYSTVFSLERSIFSDYMEENPAVRDDLIILAGNKNV